MNIVKYLKTSLMDFLKMGEDEIFCGCGYMWSRVENNECPMCGCYEGQLCEHNKQ